MSWLCGPSRPDTELKITTGKPKFLLRNDEVKGCSFRVFVFSCKSNNGTLAQLIGNQSKSDRLLWRSIRQYRDDTMTMQSSKIPHPSGSIQLSGHAIPSPSPRSNNPTYPTHDVPDLKQQEKRFSNPILLRMIIWMWVVRKLSQSKSSFDCIRVRSVCQPLI